ncbi:MAG TPA: haloacid dehalogenase [Planctomycetales bacterium]|nr:haloacid dehalogenase [Planctomycetales bacterium]
MGRGDGGEQEDRDEEKRYSAHGRSLPDAGKKDKERRGVMIEELRSAPGAVFFDAVGSLIHPDPPAPVVYAAVGRRYGSALDIEAITAHFRVAFRRQEAIDRLSGWRTDEDREYARWRAIVAETLSDAADPEACFQELYAHFARPDAWRVQAEAGPTLRIMAERGWHVGIGSNFDARLRGVVAGLPELRPVRTMVISSEVGFRKPADPFFEEIGRKTKIAPTRIVYIGDDFANDYAGARAAGMKAILFDPEGKCRDSTVRRVVDLPGLLAE